MTFASGVVAASAPAIVGVEIATTSSVHILRQIVRLVLAARHDLQFAIELGAVAAVHSFCPNIFAKSSMPDSCSDSGLLRNAARSDESRRAPLNTHSNSPTALSSTFVVG
jgi:hypothetical protein